MREIDRIGKFKRDYKREKKGQYKNILDDALGKVLLSLVNDEILPPSYNDHKLHGEYEDHRDCHITPDLVLIYRKVGQNVLKLVRLGSHAELF